MDHRLEQLTTWVRQHGGLEQASPVPVSGDASFRRYFRVTGLDGGEPYTRIVMDAPPEHEDTVPFTAIARHWHQQGVHVPEIYSEDADNGFLLLDDFGDRLFLDHVCDANAGPLYTAALESLEGIQKTTQPPDYTLPEYDAALLDREMALFRDWLLVKHLGLTLSTQEESLLETVFNALRESALAQPRVPVHRDYHSRNLLITGALNDPAIIDFQDAVIGPITYDLVSLVKDCYIRWPEERITRWIEDFRQQTLDADLHHADQATFRQWVELMGMQRHLKAAGIFARLYRRDGKDRYLADIPRTVDYLREASDRQPALRHFRDWLDTRVIPELTPEASPS